MMYHLECRQKGCDNENKSELTGGACGTGTCCVAREGGVLANPADFVTGALEVHPMMFESDVTYNSRRISWEVLGLW